MPIIAPPAPSPTTSAPGPGVCVPHTPAECVRRLERIVRDTRRGSTRTNLADVWLDELLRAQGRP